MVGASLASGHVSEPTLTWDRAIADWSSLIVRKTIRVAELRPVRGRR